MSGHVVLKRRQILRASDSSTWYLEYIGTSMATLMQQALPMTREYLEEIALRESPRALVKALQSWGLKMLGVETFQIMMKAGASKSKKFIAPPYGQSLGR